jgi:type IV pilus assembly protein PilE
MLCDGKKTGATGSETGLSLIEIMITLMIFAMLMGISVPLYSQHFITQNRFAAKTQLLKVAAALEQYYLENNSYTGATLTRLGFTNETSYQYALSMTTDNNHFAIMAAPIDKQKTDEICGTLGLESNGKKSVSGRGSLAECWGLL